MIDLFESYLNDSFQKGEESGFQKGEESGFQKGEESGFQKGEEKKARELAKNLKGMGMNASFVAQALNVDEEQALALMNEPQDR